MSILPASLRASESLTDFSSSRVEGNGAPASGGNLCGPSMQSQDRELETEGNSRSRRRERRVSVWKGKERVLNPKAQEFIPSSSSHSGRPGMQFNPNSLSLQSDPNVQKKKDGATGPLRRVTDRSYHGTKYGSVIQEGSTNNEENDTSQLSQHPRDHLAARKYRADQETLDISTASKGESLSTSAQHSSTGVFNGSKKGNSWNANHLLNFYYDPIPRPTPRVAVHRRQHKSQPYNREHFLQANFRFLVSDLGDYVTNASDPDKMLLWEHVAAVECSSSEGKYCPICLESPPLCPQITSCGHIFCFPCLLRYFTAREEVNYGDLWKKCPVCVTMVNCKELKSVVLDNVKEYQVGDSIGFSLLTRSKGSTIPLQKSESALGSFAYTMDGRCHRFSKFTLTSDMKDVTSRATAELTLAIESAQHSGGEDLEQLPYILTAIDQLKERHAAWTEHRAVEFLSCSPPVKERIIAQAKRDLTISTEGKVDLIASNSGVNGTSSGIGKADAQKRQGSQVQDVVTETQVAMEKLKEKSGWVYESPFADLEGATALGSKVENTLFISPNNTNEKAVEESQQLSYELEDVPTIWEQLVGNSPLNDHGLPSVNEVEKKERTLKKDKEDNDSYTFYQSSDGQLIILHPLSMKCLLQHFANYDYLPSRLEAKLLDLESVSQSESLRKRYPYLSHFPLTTTIQLCEVDLGDLLPEEAFVPFSEEIRGREKKRWLRQKQEQDEKVIAERAAAAAESRARSFAIHPSVTEDGNTSDHIDFPGLLKDESVGTHVQIEERKLFSRVTRLGYASGYDAPGLGVTNSVSSALSSSSLEPSLSGVGGHGDIRTTCALTSGESSKMSFADVIQSKEIESLQHNEGSHLVAKRGKKPSKLIMSTAGGRRY